MTQWKRENAKSKNRQEENILCTGKKNLKALPANFAKSHKGEQNVLINSRDLISKLAMLTAGPQEATAVVQSWRTHIARPKPYLRTSVNLNHIV